MLTHAGLDNACLAVVTTPDPPMALAVIEAVRRIASGAYVVARCRNYIFKPDMEKAGAAMVVDEENMVGVDPAEAVVDGLRSGGTEEMVCALGMSGVEPSPARPS